MACHLLLAVWLVLPVLTGLVVSACLATVVLKSTLSSGILPLSLLLCGHSMQTSSHLKLTLRGPFSLSKIIWEIFWEFCTVCNIVKMYTCLHFMQM